MYLLLSSSSNHTKKESSLPLGVLISALMVTVVSVFAVTLKSALQEDGETGVRMAGATQALLTFRHHGSIAICFHCHWAQGCGRPRFALERSARLQLQRSPHLHTFTSGVLMKSINVESRMLSQSRGRQSTHRAQFAQHWPESNPADVSMSEVDGGRLLCSSRAPDTQQGSRGRASVRSCLPAVSFHSASSQML